MSKTLLVVAVMVSCFCALPVTADNWSHWRGESGNGVSSTAKPPTEWSRTKNVQWKVAIPGRGSGSPVIWEDKVYVVTAVRSDGKDGQAEGSERSQQQGKRRRTGEKRRSGERRRRASSPIPKLQFMLLCFDRQTGDKLWAQVATETKPHQGTHFSHSFASASACTDGKHVYAHFGSRGLYCYSMDGVLAWKRDDLGKMDTRNSFGEGSSPTLVGDRIIVPWDHEGPSFLFALNKRTGETIWKTERDEPTSWATPLIVPHNDKLQVIMNGQTSARAYDLQTGKEIWRCGGQTQRPVASPVVADDLVFIGSGFRGSFLGAFRLDGHGDIEGTESVAWTVDRDTPDIASLLLSEGRLYFYKGKSGVLTCLNATTGAPYYRARRIRELNSIYASPIAAGGHVYLTGRSGTTVVIRDSEKFEIVAVNSVGETVDATPAPVDNQLFVRGERHLFCIANKNEI